jgi:hypothetical protein
MQPASVDNATAEASVFIGLRRFHAQLRLHQPPDSDDG